MSWVIPSKLSGGEVPALNASVTSAAVYLSIPLIEPSGMHGHVVMSLIVAEVRFEELARRCVPYFYGVVLACRHNHAAVMREV